MILPELLLELSVSPAADPLHIEADVRRIPVLVGVSALGLTHDLQRLVAPRRNLDRFRRHDRKDVVELGCPVSVRVCSTIGPVFSCFERPGEQRMRGRHSSGHSPVLHGPCPAQVSRVERLHVSDPDKIEGDPIDLSDLQHLDRLDSALGTAGPCIYPSISGTPARRRGHRRHHHTGRWDRRRGRDIRRGTTDENQHRQRHHPGNHLNLMIAHGRRRAQETVCSSGGGSGKSARGSILGSLVSAGG
jgi:hypothetical protein